MTASAPQGQNLYEEAAQVSSLIYDFATVTGTDSGSHSKAIYNEAPLRCEI